jgi:DNA-binding NarL/FixJ family response regulator
MVVEAAARDREAVKHAIALTVPDALVLSVHLPGGALETIEDVHKVAPAVEFVLLADEASDELMLQMVAAGAHGFLLGATDPARLPHAVAGVLAGETAFPRRFVRVMADELARRARQRRTLSRAGVWLTPRQAEIIELLSGGLDHAAISARLGITEATVRSHAATASRRLVDAKDEDGRPEH